MTRVEQEMDTMVMSEAERQRRQESQDAEPWFGGMTFGAFRELPARKKNEIYQRYSQCGATHIGLWKDCTLGKCRRAKRCSGFLTDAQYAAGYATAYPPCVRMQEERRYAVFKALDVLFPSQDAPPKYDGTQNGRASQDDD
jgi:hypothetical protein